MSSDNELVRKFGKYLAESHLETAFDKYLVIGFHSDAGGDYMTNCDSEQLALMLQLFSQMYDNKWYFIKLMQYYSNNNWN